MGARHTSIQIRGILASAATLQMKCRCSSFNGDSTRAEGVEAATESESVAATTAYPWVTSTRANRCRGRNDGQEIEEPRSQWPHQPSSRGRSIPSSRALYGSGTSSGHPSSGSEARSL